MNPGIMKDDRKWSWIFSAGIIAYSLVALYVLSIGPATFLIKHGVMTSDVYYQLYWPLERLLGQMKWTADLANWYEYSWAAL